MNLQPLRERADYGVDGDQLERQFALLSRENKNLIKDQFAGRLKGANMDSIVDKIASEILASEKEAVSPPGWSGTVRAMKHHKDITNPWALCFTADTKVLLFDGRSLTMKELVDEFGIEKSTYVFSYDIQNDKIVAGVAHDFRRTAEGAKLVEVTLDNGKKIRCTLSHMFLMNDGSYKEAQDLQSGESLMPIYFDVHEGSFCDGYKRAWSKDNKKHFVHRIAAKYKFGKEWSKGFIIHHNNFDKNNNSPDNLKLMTCAEHSTFHRTADKAQHLVDYNKSDAGRALAAVTGKRNMKKLWSERREEMIVNCKKNGSKGGDCGKYALLKYNKSQAAIDSMSRRNLDGSIITAKMIKIAKKILDFGLGINEATWNEHKGYKSNPSFNKLLEMFGSVSNFLEKFNVNIVYSTRVKYNCLKITKRILEKNLPINDTTWDKYKRSFKNPHLLIAIELFGSIDNLIFETEKKYDLITNHKVVSVNRLECVEDVYDFIVNNYHNFALDAGVFVHNSHWMAKQKPGAKWGPGGKLKKSPEPHYKPEKKKKKSDNENIDKVAEIADEVIAEVMTGPAIPVTPITESTRKFSTVDSIKTDDGYITIKANYDEKDGEVILEEYVVDKDGDVQTYNNVDDFTDRLVSEGLL